MNMATVLKTPLRATPAWSRWSMVFVLALLLVLATVLQRHASSSDPVWIPSVFSAFGQYLIGMGLLAPCLLLAIDGRQLRLPGFQRSIVLGMVFYAALSVVIPSLILCLAGAPPSMAFAFQALCLAIGLAGGILPNVFTAIITVVPSLLTAVLARFHHPVPLMVTYLWMATVALTIVTVVTWLWQVHKTEPYRLSFGTAVVMRLQHKARYGGVGWKWNGSAQSTVCHADPSMWKRPVADVRGCGPQQPRRSLRILLGGWLMPKTWQYMLGLCALVVLPATALVVFMAAQFPDPLRDLLRAFPFYGVSWLINFSSLMLGVFTARLMQQRWMKANAELSIMALLPRLGQGPAQIKNLLQAALLPTWCLQLPMAAWLCAIAVAHRGDFDYGWSVAVGQITALTFAPAFVLATFGGRALPGWLIGAVAGLSFCILGLGTGAEQFANATQATDYLPLSILMAARLIVLVFLGWLGYRGWRGLMQRPHPFLTD